jgi:AcrR family transcriptional regulator
MELSPDQRQLVDVADRLFYERGVHAVGMDDLRTAAGVSLKRLYGLFPSKRELLVAVLAQRHEVWMRGLAARVEAAPDPRARLLAVYDFLADWFAEETFRGCSFINVFGELGGTWPEVVRFARAHKDAFRAYLAGLVAEAGGPGWLAPQLALLAEGAQTTAAISGTPAAAGEARAAAGLLVAAALDAS